VGTKALKTQISSNRENLYAMFSIDGNPRFSSLAVILEKLGLEKAIPHFQFLKRAD
jgi:DNA-binding phage protein